MIEYELIHALEEDSCPVCNVINEHMKKVMWWFKTENYHEASTMEMLSENPYICKRHKKDLLEIGDNLSVTFEFLIKGDMKIFDILDKHLSKKHFIPNYKLNKKLFNNLSYNNVICKFCADEEEFSIYACKSFANLIRKQELKKAYTKSCGLCRKHLISIIDFSDIQEKQFLVQEVIKRLKHMEQLFKSFFHKLDYRFSDEEKGDEQNTWIKALKFYSNG